uniref:Uncharacterized protein n=1 Tax=viral metagenome TaxID=1070528 RepID=A0A6H1ZUH9_9ZZZZ
MNQLTDDVKTLKDAGFISIARQYARMAKSLKEIHKYARSYEFDKNLFHNLTMAIVKDMAFEALRRFEK